jgi:hypothetical protein
MAQFKELVEKKAKVDREQHILAQEMEQLKDQLATFHDQGNAIKVRESLIIHKHKVFLMIISQEAIEEALVERIKKQKDVEHWEGKLQAENNKTAALQEVAEQLEQELEV